MITVETHLLSRLEDPVAKAKKKQLPKDFESLLEKGNLEELKILFDTYDVNARGGLSDDN